MREEPSYVLHVKVLGYDRDIVSSVILSSHKGKTISLSLSSEGGGERISIIFQECDS